MYGFGVVVRICVLRCRGKREKGVRRPHRPWRPIQFDRASPKAPRPRCGTEKSSAKSATGATLIPPLMQGATTRPGTGLSHLPSRIHVPFFLGPLHRHVNVERLLPAHSPTPARGSRLCCLGPGSCRPVVRRSCWGPRTCASPGRPGRGRQGTPRARPATRTCQRSTLAGQWHGHTAGSGAAVEGTAGSSSVFPFFSSFLSTAEQSFQTLPWLLPRVQRGNDRGKKGGVDFYRPWPYAPVRPTHMPIGVCGPRRGWVGDASEVAPPEKVQPFF